MRERLSAEQGERLESWVAEYEAAQSRGELDPAVDMRAAVLMLWSIELGLGVIEALGLEAPDPDDWAELTGRLIQSIAGPGRLLKRRTAGVITSFSWG